MQPVTSQHKGITQETACHLLKQRGYDMVCPVEHVHATDRQQQWHVCRVVDLASMEPEQFLACLDEALSFVVFSDEATRSYKKGSLPAISLVSSGRPQAQVAS